MDFNEIPSLYLARAQNGEHINFEEDVHDVFTESFATSVNLKGQRTQMEQIYDEIIKAYLINQKYEQTADVQQLDHERDELFITFKSAIDFYKRGGTTAQKTAAKAVYFLLEPYRHAAKKSYANATTELRDFTRDVQVTPYAAHLATLGQTDAIVALQAANEAFHTLYSDRTTAELHRAQLEKIREARHQWDEVYRLVAKALPVLYLTETDAAKKQSIGAVIEEITAFVLRLRKTLERRGVTSSSSNGTGGGDTPSDETPEEPETPPSGGGDGGGDEGSDNTMG
jgi:hypothetical protein